MPFDLTLRVIDQNLSPTARAARPTKRKLGDDDQDDDDELDEARTPPRYEKQRISSESHSETPEQ